MHRTKECNAFFSENFPDALPVGVSAIVMSIVVAVSLQVSRSEVFQEITLELATREWKLAVSYQKLVNSLKWMEYPPKQER